MRLSHLKHFINKPLQAAGRFYRDSGGVAAIEAAILLPVMLIIMIGMFDIGQAIIINQKVTSAAQTAGDLLARQPSVTNADLDDARIAALLVIDPYDRTLLGTDIVGIAFDPDDDPQEMWRETVNMIQDSSLPSAAAGLGVDGEGLIAVTTVYEYTPYFSNFVVNTVEMTETAFLRGRINSYVPLN